MAEEKQQPAASGTAPHPAEDQAAGTEGTTQSRRFGMQGLLILGVTAVLYAGSVFASSGFTEKIVVPKLSHWLVVREVERLAAEEAAGELPPFGEIFVIEDLVVNPAGSEGTRYLCVSVGLETSDSTVLEEVNLRDAQIKDALIQIFSSKTIRELADVNAREAIRNEIELRIEDILPDPGLDAVYFVNFVLQ